MMTTHRRQFIAGLVTLPLIGLLPPGRGFAQDGTLSGDIIESSAGPITLHPVNHASLLIGWGEQVLYVDPVGGAGRYAGLPAPTGILITHAHGDHFDPATLRDIAGDAPILTTEQVLAQLPEGLKEKAGAVGNGETADFAGIRIDAVPAYNTTEERLQYHPKGVGNGYVLNIGDKRIYVAGDTEDVPEMRALANIDVVFLPMNLPYTMSVEQAADAIKAFRPGIVYPYHYQGSKVETLAGLVGDVAEIRLRDWY